ncbi:MAG: hypothetical protein IK077_16485, partial [Thermoguttaceae bacterium]|nr:hypothetical protein [Thermoguttaceae bacterium]
MNAKSSAKFFQKRKKTGLSGSGIKPRLLRAEPLEERALLSVSPVGLVAPGGCDVPLDPWDDVCVASERNESLVVSFDCPGCSALASSMGDVEAYPAFGESIDEALIAAGQNLDAISRDFVFNLSSLPESTYTIYLDFDGNVVSGSSWNNGDTIVTPPYDVDGNEGSFSNVELRHIYEIWRRVSENYIPFNVNVTTKKPTTDQLMKSDAADDEYGIHVAIGGSCDDWYKSGAGGVAYVGSFSWDSDTPCFVFPKSLAGPRTVADAITHEVGHTLGLGHDGRIAHDDVEKEEYFGGANGWGPHMGAAYSADITQWSKGEYEFASNLQDDLEIITTRNGFTYRDDDHGDDLTTATPLMFDVSGTLGSGIIERNTDVDFFSFTLSGEKTVISVGGVESVTSLDAFVNLYDASGELVATYDPLDTFYVTIDTAELAPGKYYLGVSGTGRCVDGVLHYTDYSSLGAYTIVTNNEKSIDDYEPNNSFTKAVELGFLSGTSSYDSYVGASDGEDWYRFTIGATGTADNFVRVNYERDPDRHCLFFGLYDANQKQLDYQFTLSVSEETVSLANRPAGTYYVKIYNYFNLDEPFPYSLTVNAPSAQPPVVHEVGAVELSTIKPYVGTTLTATAFPADATVAWQWYRGTRSDFVKSPIVGANSNAYTPTVDDVGYYLSVQAVGTGDYEGLSTASTVSPVLDKLVSATLSSDKPALGTALEATLSPAGADVVWQWYRGTKTDLFGTKIDGANEASYVPTVDDVGSYLTVVAIGSGFYEGTVTVTASSPVEGRVVSVNLSSNSPKVGTKLTASASPAVASVSWQWYRGTHSDFFNTPIKGANANSYTPTAADEGYYISVKAFGTGDYGGEASATTASPVGGKPKDIYEPNNSSSNAYDLGSLSGTTTIGSYVGASDGNDWYTFTTGATGDADSLIKVNYEYDYDAHCIFFGLYDSNLNEIDHQFILGVSEEKISLNNRPAGTYFIRIYNYFDLNEPFPYSLTLATPKVDDPNAYKLASVELSTDEPSVGAAITTTLDPENAVVAWQWYRGTSDNLFKTAISGATESVYTPTTSDLGYYLSVKVIGKDGYQGTVSASTSEKVARRLVSVSLSSTEPTLGEKIKATVSPSGASVSWQWYRSTGSDAVAISGATKDEYVPTAADVGAYLFVVATGKGEYAGSVRATTDSTVARKVVSVSLPTTKPSVGATITATVSPSDADVVWQWYRGTSSDAFETPIVGANKGEYTPTSDDSGYYLGVKAIGKGDYRGTATASTKSAVPFDDFSVALSSMKPSVGAPITATVDPESATVTWQWYRGTSSNLFQTAISGATKNSYTPTSADVGYYLSVKAIGKGDYEGTVAASTNSKVVRGLTSVALSTNEPEMGKELTATVSPSGADVVWRWYRGTSSEPFQTAISGATSSSYTPTQDDLGFYLSVEAVGKGDYDGTVCATSESAVVVKDLSVALSSTKPSVGASLTATLYPQGAEATWQWYRGTSSNAFQTAISGATKSSYTPTSADLGFYLGVKAVGKGDYQGTATAATSAKVVDKIVSVDLPTGKPYVGTTLTATVAPDNADVSWQWYRGTSSDAFQTAISGATDRSYTPTSDDLGLYLSVKASGKGDYEG